MKFKRKARAQNGSTIATVDRLLETLMKLYVAALNLPEMEPETVERSTEPSSAPVLVRIKEGIPSGYWEIYDPFKDEEPVCGSLYDDLSDIITDLQSGCEEFEAGRIGNAVFEWRFGLDNHWGHHAVDLIKGGRYAISTDNSRILK